MDIRDLRDDLARSIGFLSRLPVPEQYFLGYDGSLSRAVRAFPLAGCIIALPAALLYCLLLALDMDPLLAGFLALAVTTLLTGGLHEDGLADTADGFGGGRDRDGMLTIMRDSRIGTYGAIALILSYGTRAAALGALGAALPPLAAGLTLIVAACLSRACMVWHWSALPAARRDGVAVSSGRPDGSATNFALASAAAIAAAIVWAAIGVAAALTTIAAAGLVSWAATRYIDRRIGGHSGDTIGAVQQCSEIAVLVILVFWV